MAEHFGGGEKPKGQPLTLGAERVQVRLAKEEIGKMLKERLSDSHALLTPEVLTLFAKKFGEAETLAEISFTLKKFQDVRFMAKEAQDRGEPLDVEKVDLLLNGPK